ncbi:flagellar protein FlhE [Herbaspirillum lusitanum]|uniref:Flagellar protein FlhE n=1 Tax=Herbaspirillum lusitanum TaxID=213312 RepID=A0ABW9A852_9BURK
MGPGIVAKNADYATSFRVSVPVPPGASINNVSWRYGVASKPAGFEAVLCWQDQNSCWNVTRNAAGSTRFFNGKDAARGFTLYYRVKGSGPLPGPVNGEMNQVIVTYDLPG